MEERPADPAQMINSFKLLKSPIVYPSTNTPAPFHTFLFSYYIGFFLTLIFHQSQKLIQEENSTKGGRGNVKSHSLIKKERAKKV